MSFQMTAKQKEYWNNANMRWNVKVGATRSGKTWLDYYLIPKRIRAIENLPGIVLLMGNTEATLERNILEPLRNIYGASLVGYVTKNRVKLFGRVCYAIGADKINQVQKIQGSSVAYAYGDEVVTWHPKVFDMLKSRLDKSYSKFDGTCNPEAPSHWFKSFLDSDADIYLQHYTIDDNTFLPKSFVEALKKEYANTVYYLRYVLGLWANAEGLLFRQLANNPSNWEVEELPVFAYVSIGVDIGGVKSHTPIITTGLTGNFDEIITFEERKIMHSKGAIDINSICEKLEEAYLSAMSKGYSNILIFVDNAEQVIINSINTYLMKKGHSTMARDCKKVKGKTRILLYNKLLNSSRMKFHKVPITVESLSTALYDEKMGEDAILDDFTTDIDTFDAHFYSWSYFVDYIFVGGV